MNSLGGNKRCVYLIHMTVYYHNQLGVKKNKNELPTKYTFAHAVQCTCSITSKFEMFAQCLNSSNPAKLYILFSIITINICYLQSHPSSDAIKISAWFENENKACNTVWVYFHACQRWVKDVGHTNFDKTVYSSIDTPWKWIALY